MRVTLTSLEALQDFVSKQPASLLYFAGEGCNVCAALYPKIEEMLHQEFPRMGLGRVECGEHPDICAQHRVFSVPTLVVLFDGHESQRFVRNISIGALRQTLQRPYRLLFDEQ